MKNFLRRLITFLSYSCLTVIIGIYLLFFLNLSTQIEGLKNEIELTVFLKDDLTAETIGQLGEKLRHDEKIGKVSYTSKDEALKEFQNEPLLSRAITTVGENPLPASFTVYPRIYEEGVIYKLSTHISSFPEVEKVVYNTEILAKYKYLTTLSKSLRVCNYIFLGIISLILISLFVYTAYTFSWVKSFPILLEQVSLALPGILSGLILLHLFSKTLKENIVFFNFTQIFFFFLGIVTLSVCLSFYLNLLVTNRANDSE